MSVTKKSGVSCRRALMTTVAAIACFGAASARAGTPIDTSQPDYLQSQVGISVLPDFQGGTLRDDQNNVTDAHNYTVEDFATNTIDAFGDKVTFTGNLTGPGSMTLTDSVGGGKMIVAGVGNIAGGVTIANGATMQWGTGSAVGFFAGTSFVNNGSLIMDFGAANGVASCQCMPISGSGDVTVKSGTWTTAANTYTGDTTIAAGATLLNSGAGAISGSSDVIVNGTYDISGEAAGASIVSLSGSGSVKLGDQTLTLTNASGAFSGVFSDAGMSGGTAGSVTIAAGTEAVRGNSVIGGAVTINSGATLAWGIGFGVGYLVGSGSSVVDNGALVVNFGGAGLGDNFQISGSGSVAIQSGSLSDFSASTYTGATTINAMASLVLAGSGSIANSSGVADNGILDISGTTGTSITGLSGSGVVNLGGQTLTLSNASGVFSGAFSDGGLSGGVGGSVVIGGGTQTVSGSNILTGAVTIDNGATLVWGNGGAAAYLLGAGSTLTDNGSLVMNFGAGGLSGVIPVSGSGSITIQSGSLTDNGVSTYTGATTINAGAVFNLTGAGSIANSSGVTANGDFNIAGTTAGTSITSLSGSGAVGLGSHTLTLSSADGTFSGVISDGGLGGALTVAAGAETLSGTNTYTGATTIDAGATLQLGGGGATGSVAGVIVDNGLLLFDYSGSTTVANSISGTGSAEVVAGAPTITNTSVIGGTVTIDSGATLNWGDGSGVGYLMGAGNGVIDNGSLVMNFGAGSLTGAIPISGSGAVTLKSGSFAETAASTYTGATTIDAGAVFILSGAGSVAGSSGVTANGTLDISGTAAGASIVSLSGSGSVDLGGQTLTLSNASGTFSGVLSDGGLSGGSGAGLTIAGGTETLTGANTYAGVTTVNAGATLQLGDGVVTGSVAGSIVDNGLLQLNFAGPVTVSNSITGSGDAEVVAGAVVVTGSSSIGGAVTVDSGASLAWGDGSGVGYLLGAGGGVVNNGSLVMNFGGGSLSGDIPISGSGGVTVQSGSINDSGVSTYTGATIIDAGAQFILSGSGSIADSSGVTANGTLDISGTTSGASIISLSGSGAVDLGGQTLTLSNASGTFSGTFSDGGLNGGVTIAAGAETVTGSSTIGGTVTIASGATLNWGDGTGPAFLVGGGNGVVDNGALVMNFGAGGVGGDTPISGSGSVTVQSGSFSDAGVSTYTGATTINSGATLVLSGAGSIADSSGVAANGVLDISGTTAGASITNLTGAGSVKLGAQSLTLTNAGGTFSGVLSDGGLGGGVAGGLTIAGGTETLTGTNTYTGSTTINAGAALRLGAGGVTGSVATNIVDNGMLTFNRSNTVTYAGVISGAGSLVQAGTGTTILNGVNTVTGQTLVSNGVLEVGDASHAGAVLDSHLGGLTVGAAGTLEGHGAVNGAVTNIAGGTVAPGGTIGTLTVGSYTQGANSTLAIEVSPAAASQLNSLGAASLAGKLALTFDAGTYGPHIYEIVAGAPVTGVFSTVTAVGSPGVGVVDGLFYTGTQVDLVVAPTAGAQVYGGLSTATLDRAQDFAGLVEDRFGGAGCATPSTQGAADDCHGMGAWAQVLASSDRVSGSSGGFGFNNTGAGFIGGVDHRWDNGASVGVAFGYEQNSLTMSEASSKATGASYFGALYGRWVAGPVLLDGQAFYMHSSWSVDRTVAGYGVASSSPSGNTEGFLAQASLPMRDGDIRPYARVSYASFNRDSATESGVGPLAFAVSSGSTTSTQAEVGVQLSHSYQRGDGREWTPSLQLGVQDNFGDRTPSVAGSLAGVAGTSFTQDSVRIPQVAATVDASLKLKISQRFDVTGDMRGRFGGGQTDASASVGGVLRF